MNITTEWKKVAYGAYLKEVQGILTSSFGIAAGNASPGIVSEYHAAGRSPNYCAHAIARSLGFRPR